MPLVEVTVRDGLALLELHAPPANRYSYEMMIVAWAAGRRRGNRSV